MPAKIILNSALAVFTIVSTVLLTSCNDRADSVASDHSNEKQAPGPREILRHMPAGEEGQEVILVDVIIPPNAAMPKHFHPTEEYVYIIEGSAIHRQEGQSDVVLNAGDSYVIPPRAVHSPQGGEDGARAIVIRIHPVTEPERTLVED